MQNGDVGWGRVKGGGDGEDGGGYGSRKLFCVCYHCLLKGISGNYLGRSECLIVLFGLDFSGMHQAFLINQRKKNID